MDSYVMEINNHETVCICTAENTEGSVLFNDASTATQNTELLRLVTGDIKG
jgi:hypothetical protein